MIIPVIFTLDPVYENLSQTWVFYKAVSFCKKYGWPVIAQEQYFMEWEKQRRIFPQFFQTDMCAMFEYDVPQKGDLSKIQQISIPKEIEQRFISLNRTQSDAYMVSFREGWKEMEDFLCDSLQKIMENSGEKIEALTCLTYVKFMDNVSRRTNIPVIYYEWGPFRYSAYRNTAFFDLNGEFKEVHSVIENFNQENGFEGLPILKNNEILALLLKENYLRYLTEDNTLKPYYDEYEMGIVGGYNSLIENNAYTYLNMVELYNNALKIFDENNIAVRYHPGDPIHARMNVPNEKEGELIDFILSCKRVVCTSNNIAVETMLYGKKVYDIRKYRYQGIVNGDIIQLDDREPSLEEINFIVFVTIIPFELLNSVEYIRFRLSMPDLNEIYLYHLKYYLECLGISYDRFIEEKDHRLMLILESRGTGISLGNYEQRISDRRGEREFYILVQRYKYLEKRYADLESARHELAEKLEKNESEKEDLGRQLESAENAREEDAKQYNQQIEVCQTENEKLKCANEELNAEIEQLRKRHENIMNTRIMKLIRKVRRVLRRQKINEE